MRKEKIITRTRQYLCGLVICLRPQSCGNFTIIREKIRVRQYSFFSFSQKKQQQTLITKTAFSTSCT